MRAVLATLALAATFAAAPVLAQDAQPRPDQRVMLILTPQREVEGYHPPQALRGTLLAADADSLTVQLHPGTGPVRVARTAVRRMFVSRGIPGRAQSAATGAVGGAIGGAAAGWFYNPDRNGRSDEQAALLGAGLGGGFGMVMGAIFPRERWKRVRAPRGVSVAPAVSGQGGGLALDLRI